MPGHCPPHFRQGIIDRTLGGESVLSLVRETSVPGCSIRKATRVCGVNRSTFDYRTRPKPPGNRELRRLLVADVIGQVHEASRGTYGYRRVQPALRIERNLNVNHKLVASVMAD